VARLDDGQRERLRTGRGLVTLRCTDEPDSWVWLLQLGRGVIDDTPARSPKGDAMLAALGGDLMT
jgi:hypothetical protein